MWSHTHISGTVYKHPHFTRTTIVEALSPLVIWTLSVGRKLDKTSLDRTVTYFTCTFGLTSYSIFLLFEDERNKMARNSGLLFLSLLGLYIGKLSWIIVQLRISDIHIRERYQRAMFHLDGFYLRVS